MTAILLALALLMNSGGNSAGQNAHTSPSNTQKELFLTRANDGQRVSAKVGQSIVVTKQSVKGHTAPRKYHHPQSDSIVPSTYPHGSRTPAAQSRYTDSPQLLKEKRKSGFHTQIQPPRLRLRFRSQNDDRLESPSFRLGRFLGLESPQMT
jgi:hypothetical protein